MREAERLTGEAVSVLSIILCPPCLISAITTNQNISDKNSLMEM
jgi:hypothetical protein